MTIKRQPVRSAEERDILVKQFYFLPQHIVNKLWGDASVRRLGHQDAIQIGFLHLIRAAELWEISRGIQFKTYAYKSVLCGILHACGQKKYKVYVQFSTPEELIPDRWYENKSPEMELEEEGVLAAINLLPERLKRIMLATCLESKTYTEVGKELHISKERVRQLRDKALKWLRAHLSGLRPIHLRDGSFYLKNGYEHQN